MEEVLTVKQVAEYFHVTEKTIYKLSQSGELPGFKVGGSWRFKRSDIEKWIESNVNHPRLSNRGLEGEEAASQKTEG
jgi:excisionase family DNA binding protein